MAEKVTSTKLRKCHTTASCCFWTHLFKHKCNIMVYLTHNHILNIQRKAENTIGYFKLKVEDKLTMQWQSTKNTKKTSNSLQTKDRKLDWRTRTPQKTEGWISGKCFKNTIHLLQKKETNTKLKMRRYDTIAIKATIQPKFKWNEC